VGSKVNGSYLARSQGSLCGAGPRLRLEASLYMKGDEMDAREVAEEIRKALGDRIGSTTEPDTTGASRRGVLFELVTPDKRFAIEIEEVHGVS
jgi:hypothetical protein